MPTVNTLMLTHPDFPEILRNIPNAPKQLYWSGSNPDNWLKKPKVAVVGSRKISVYGEAVTRSLASELATCGVVIISGLAYGVDIVAHRSALNVGGLTVAVLAGGLDRYYPASHASVANQLIKNGGTIFSEYPQGAPSLKQNFIARNRIVSGLADVLLITEASASSGTMHTAKFALEQGKTVMAIPGNITSPGSEGTNNLIKSGALPVTNVSDVLFALDYKKRSSPTKPVIAGTNKEKSLLKLITEGLTSQEDLALASELDSAEIASTLTMLEISGYIRPLGSGNWGLN